MAPNQLATKQTRMDKRDMAVLRLGIFQTEVERRCISWQIAARNVGSAYKTADNMCRDALSKKGAADGLEIQIFFSVLTVVSAGALGWVSTAAAAAHGGVETALSDALEATGQAFIGEVFSANGPLVFPPKNGSPVNPDPQVYQNELENRIDQLRMDILGVFNQIRLKYMEMKLESWDRYDETVEMAAHRKWMAEADKLSAKDDLPDTAWMAEEIERGRWKAYVLDNHSYRDFGIYQTDDTPDGVGDAVRQRLEALGAVKHLDKTVAFQGGSSFESQLTERDWRWAQNYPVRSFLSQKLHPIKIVPVAAKPPTHSSPR